MDEKQVFIDGPKQTAVNEPRAAALNAGSTETLDQLRAAANIPHEGTALSIDRQHFLNRCNEANTIIDNAYTSAQIFLISLSRSYRLAWERHTLVLKAAEAEEKLFETLVLESAINFIAGTLGGVAGSAMKRMFAGTPLVDGMQELVTQTLESRRATEILLQLPRFKAFSDRPEDWEGNVETAILEERLFVGKQLASWQRSVNVGDPDFKVDFDPVEKINGALRVNGRRLEDLPKIDVEHHAMLFERGFWAEWLRRFSYGVGYSLGGTLLPRTAKVEKRVPVEIGQRIRQLGLDPSPYLREASARAFKEARSRGFGAFSNETKPYDL